ncbi:MAG TPA: hypothetical protein VMW64_00825 [Dehalococcoidia bacterium]|nr:hypothetical protein [Dehalococcoidia bacterium]
MKVKFPKFNVKGLKRHVVLSEARDPAEEHLWPVLNTIGEDKIKWLINNDRRFYPHIPEEWKQALKSAEKYRWALEALTDDDLVSLLPPWLVKLIKADEKAQIWVNKEIKWLRSQVGGEHER